MRRRGLREGLKGRMEFRENGLRGREWFRGLEKEDGGLKVRCAAAMFRSERSKTTVWCATLDSEDTALK